MSNQPTSWKKALTEAERICHRRLCAILGLTDGVDAFISTNGGRYDCAVFDIGYAETGDVFGFAANRYHFRGRVDLYNRNRDLIQEQVMKILEAMPIGQNQSVTDDLYRNTCVAVFRTAPITRAVEEITTVELKAKKDDEGVAVFTTAVHFDIVFSAGVRAPVQA